MQATRILQQRALTKLAQKTAQASHNGVLFRAAASASAKATVPKPRSVSTQATTSEEALQLLNKQRALRPSSPHLWAFSSLVHLVPARLMVQYHNSTIYEPQLGWISSIANRVTGTGLSAGIYAFAIAYAGLPLIGSGFTSASLISLVASAPLWAKVAGKVILGAPAVYHTLNGCRHLLWDMGYFLELKSAWTAGYAVIALSAVGTLGLVML
ncbi:cytochrome b subunit of succinate dehydrogenase, Sdh3p [Cystobasidiomycetes sp. EMM_F5]